MMISRTLSPLALILLLFCLLPLNGPLQAQRFKIESGSVNFFAGTPLEDIDGTSDKLVGVIDTETNDFAFRIAMNSFEFPRKLMQEHYNENYLETERYPNADFKGKIEGMIDWKVEGSYAVRAKGIFDVHGVQKTYDVPATVVVEGGQIRIDCRFDMVLEDHDIKRPKIVLMKIAEKADVKVRATLVGM
jgi:hypothetical protein